MKGYDLVLDSDFWFNTFFAWNLLLYHPVYLCKDWYTGCAGHLNTQNSVTRNSQCTMKYRIQFSGCEAVNIIKANITIGVNVNNL